MAFEIGRIDSEYTQQKPAGQVAGAYVANYNTEDVNLKNRLSNEKLPGGIFTFPNAC
ncbi:hypothetical protein IKB17_05215 [bacterium]|nr:hypothetical protein [bacterium]